MTNYQKLFNLRWMILVKIIEFNHLKKLQDMSAMFIEFYSIISKLS